MYFQCRCRELYLDHLPEILEAKQWHIKSSPSETFQFWILQKPQWSLDFQFLLEEAYPNLGYQSIFFWCFFSAPESKALIWKTLSPSFLLPQRSFLPLPQWYPWCWAFLFLWSSNMREQYKDLQPSTCWYHLHWSHGFTAHRYQCKEQPHHQSIRRKLETPSPQIGFYLLAFLKFDLN